MAYELVLTDASGTDTLQATEVPLTITPIEGAVDVQTLSYNIYTDFIAQKRAWSHTWAYMSESDFNVLKGYYDRQFTAFTYPLLTITDLGVDEVPVRMRIEPQNIIDNCGVVRDVTVSFRESKQNNAEGLLMHDNGFLEI